jgi:hypothetical protein
LKWNQNTNKSLFGTEIGPLPEMIARLRVSVMKPNQLKYVDLKILIVIRRATLYFYFIMKNADLDPGRWFTFFPKHT